MKNGIGTEPDSHHRVNDAGRGIDGAPARRAQTRRSLRRESRGNARRKLDAWVDARLPLALRARAKARWFAGWKQQLALLLEAFGRRRDNGAVASFETHSSRSRVLYLCFRQLREELGFKFQDVRVFRTRHLRGLISLWVREGIEASTINLRLSVLRGFSRWIGKAGVVPKTADLGRIGFSPSVAARHSAAQEDKSWEGVDKEAVFRAIDTEDRRFGLIFRMQDAFGLRRLEAIRFRPHEDQCGDRLEIFAGTKGGRLRYVPVACDRDRELLAACRDVVARGDSLSGKDLPLKLAQGRYLYFARKFGATRAKLGVTGHGLRHGYVHRRYQEAFGVEAPVRRDAKREIAEALGHSRTSILSAYAGSERRGRDKSFQSSRGLRSPAPCDPTK